MKKLMRLILCIALLHNQSYGNANIIFVPRQLSYNPILEDALVFAAQGQDSAWDYFFSAKPIYSQNIGTKFQQYFIINNKSLLSVQENGSGDIGSLWFQVIASPTTLYSSDLSFDPQRQTFGTMLYFAIKFPHNLELIINTALVDARNTMNISETNISNQGTTPGLQTITQAFANPALLFGKIDGPLCKAGFEDIQVKLLYNLGLKEPFYWDFYGLLGIPTSSGTQAEYLFEPMLGSKHLQIGLGTDASWDMHTYEKGRWSLQGVIKWRYTFSADEMRSFDLTNNGDWSRYLLFVNSLTKSVAYPAINDLTFNAQVTPGNSLDLYLATHWDHDEWRFELGYDFWYRAAEKIAIPSALLPIPSVGIADLVGIAALTPESASRAKISQGVLPGSNQIPSDATFINVTPSNINLDSGGAPQSISNSFYASIGYNYARIRHDIHTGLSVSYERGHTVNVPDNISIWLNIDVTF